MLGMIKMDCYTNKSNAGFIIAAAIIFFILILFFLWWLGSRSNQNRNNGNGNNGNNSNGNNSNGGNNGGNGTYIPVIFNTELTGEQEVPPHVTYASGNGIATLNSSRTAINYDFTVNGVCDELTGAHFHLAPIGQTGPIVKDLNIQSLGDNNYRLQGTWSRTDANQPLTNDLVQAFLNNDIYVNVHNSVYPEGEVRGQLLKQ